MPSNSQKRRRAPENVLDTVHSPSSQHENRRSKKPRLDDYSIISNNSRGVSTTKKRRRCEQDNTEEQHPRDCQSYQPDNKKRRLEDPTLNKRKSHRRSRLVIDLEDLEDSANTLREHTQPKYNGTEQRPQQQYPQPRKGKQHHTIGSSYHDKSVPNTQNHLQPEQNAYASHEYSSPTRHPRPKPQRSPLEAGPSESSNTRVNNSKKRPRPEENGSDNVLVSPPRLEDQKAKRPQLEDTFNEPGSHQPQGTNAHDSVAHVSEVNKFDPKYWVPGPEFWNSLSKIYLTRGALRELDRRNAPTKQQRSKRNLWWPTEGALEYLAHRSSRSLRRIRDYSKHGGPDLRDLQGYPDPTTLIGNAMAVRSDSGKKSVLSRVTQTTEHAATTTARTKSTGPYSLNFGQILRENRIFDYGDTMSNGEDVPEPDNFDEIEKVINQARDSDLTQKDYKAFMRAGFQADRESQVVSKVLPFLEGEVKDPRCRGEDTLFTNLGSISTIPLTAPKPDIYYGSRSEHIDETVRETLNKLIIPTKDSSKPVVPNFFLVVKGQWGTSAIAYRQARYDGSIGARAMQHLQSYGQQSLTFDNKAYTLVAIYMDSYLRLFCVNPARPKDSSQQPAYYIHLVAAHTLLGNLENFQRGVNAFQNARDWAEKQRDEAIAKANERAREPQTNASVPNGVNTRRSPGSGKAEGDSRQTDNEHLESDESEKTSRMNNVKSTTVETNGENQTESAEQPAGHVSNGKSRKLMSPLAQTHNNRKKRKIDSPKKKGARKTTFNLRRNSRSQASQHNA